MAIDTLVWSETIDNYRMAARQPSLCMTCVAEYIRVAPRQKKGCAFVVIECRRPPAVRVMAVFTKRFAVFRELLAVHVRVTILAICRGVLEER